MQQTRDEVIQTYQEKIKQQEDKVEVHRAKLYEIGKKLGIPYHGINSNITPDTPPAEELGDTADKAIISAENHTQFGKIKDEYEREFNILQSIKSAEIRETLVSGLEVSPLQIHKMGWSKEIAEMMEARKKEK